MQNIFMHSNSWANEKNKKQKKRRKRISLRRKFEILCIHGRISRENRIKEKGKSIYE